MQITQHTARVGGLHPRRTTVRRSWPSGRPTADRRASARGCRVAAPSRRPRGRRAADTGAPGRRTRTRGGCRRTRRTMRPTGWPRSASITARTLVAGTGATSSSRCRQAWASLRGNTSDVDAISWPSFTNVGPSRSNPSTTRPPPHPPSGRGLRAATTAATPRTTVRAARADGRPATNSRTPMTSSGSAWVSRSALPRSPGVGTDRPAGRQTCSLPACHGVLDELCPDASTPLDVRGYLRVLGGRCAASSATTTASCTDAGRSIRPQGRCVGDISGVVSRLDRADRSDGHLGAVPAEALISSCRSLRGGPPTYVAAAPIPLHRSARRCAGKRSITLGIVCCVAAEDEPHRTTDALIEHRQKVVRCAVERVRLGHRRVRTPIASGRNTPCRTRIHRSPTSAATAAAGRSRTAVSPSTTTTVAAGPAPAHNRYRPTSRVARRRRGQTPRRAAAATGQQVAKYQRSDRALVGEAALLRVDPFESSRYLFRPAWSAPYWKPSITARGTSSIRRLRDSVPAGNPRRANVMSFIVGAGTTTKHTKGCHGYSPISRIGDAGLRRHGTGR